MIPNQSSPSAPLIMDPSVFKSMTFTGANSTESTPIPVGEWDFTIDSVDIARWQKRDDPTTAGLKCVLKMSTIDGAVTAVTGRPKNTVIHEIMLDLTPESGLDFSKGMNVALGRARAACGINDSSKPFNFDMFLGKMVKAQIKHDPWDGKLLAKVVGLAAASAEATGPVYVPGQ